MILHILWMILKFIGITLLVILGILVLLICIVLFTPFRYQAAISCKGTTESLEGEIKVSWLAHLIAAQINLDGGEVKILARAAWKNLYDSAKENAEKHVDEDSEKSKSADQNQKQAESMETPASEKEAKPSLITEKHDASPNAETSGESREHEEMPEKSFLPFSFLKKIWNVITGIWEKIKYTIGRICDNIKILSEKKEKILDFLNDEVHQGAFQKTLKEVKRLLIVLCPRKINGNIRFGFDDPYLTGKTLAVLGALYPLWGETLSVTPEFDTKIFEGDIFIRGKVRIAGFVRTVAALLLDKQVRRTIRDVRKFRL